MKTFSMKTTPRIAAAVVDCMHGDLCHGEVDQVRRIFSRVCSKFGAGDWIHGEDTAGPLVTITYEYGKFND